MLRNLSIRHRLVAILVFVCSLQVLSGALVYGQLKVVEAHTATMGSSDLPIMSMISAYAEKQLLQ
ncbi:MAG: hypothetical protein VW258_10715, partial [Thalassolituus sp.]